MHREGNTVEQVFGGTVIKKGNHTPLGFNFRTENGQLVDLTGSIVQVKVASDKGMLLEKEAIVLNAYTAQFVIEFKDITETGNIRIEFVVTYPGGTIEKFPSGDLQCIKIMPKHEEEYKVENIIFENIKENTDKKYIDFTDQVNVIITDPENSNTEVIKAKAEEDKNTFATLKSPLDAEQKKRNDLPNLGSSSDLRDLVSPMLDRGINVKDCGAVGDWNEDTRTGTDDSVAFQKAIDKAYMLNTFVYIPSSQGYKISNSLITRSGTTFIGENYYNGIIESRKNKTRIVTYATPVFRINPADENSKPRLVLKNIAFTDKTGSGAVLVEYKLESSYVEDNFFYNYLCVLNNGAGRLTYIQRNSFLNVRKYAMKGDFIDSYILNNYINNAPSIQGTVGIYCTNLSMSKVSGNFIDFSEVGIRVETGKASSIIDNIIDYCFRGIYLNAVRGYIISLNKFNHITKAYATHNSRVPTDEMTTNNWIGICLNKSITGCVISENVATDTDLLISIESEGYKNLRINGNLNAEAFDNTIKLNRKAATWFSGDGENLEIEDLSFRKVNTLPNPILTGSRIVSFDNQVCYINGYTVRNVNGTWRDTKGKLFGFDGVNMLPNFNDVGWNINSNTINGNISNDGKEITFTTTGVYQDAYYAINCIENEKYLFITDTTINNKQGNRHLMEVWYYNDSNTKLGQSTLYPDKTERVFTTPTGCVKFHIRLRGDLPSNTYTFKRCVLVKHNEYLAIPYG
ncbi:NosD domain-containing protein [Priestia megaterium]|uniref:NosD domain-containing protein n=1 Tax=Priestia megaterium TaxID=1404 RepID=UPI00301BD786